MNNIVPLHPLSLVDISQFKDGSVLNKSLQPTPPTTWDLAMKLKESFNLGELDPNIYFNNLSKRIELDEANIYFDKLLHYMVDNYDDILINNIINKYKYTELISSEINLINLVHKLKE